MQLYIRATAFAGLTSAVYAADAHYRSSVLTPAEVPAAVRQVNGAGAASLATLHEQGNLIDDAALGATALAAVICFGTWRPAPAVTRSR